MTEILTQGTRRNFIQTIGNAALALAAGWARPGFGNTREIRMPNFVIIFCDDLGYGDLSCYGAEKIRTPNLDRMAEEGMRFNSFYACAPVCTPSRAGLLTGRYPIRSGLTNVLFPYSQDGIDDTEITLAKALKTSGYATACIGKWHLGHLPPYLPTRHGFDYYFGIPYSNDMDVPKRGDPPIPLMRNEEIIEQPAFQDTLTRRYTEEAIRFIAEHKNRPFFLYLPHTMPHVPLHVSPSFAGRSPRGLYGGVVEEIDWSVGEILAALKKLDLEENTLVIFTSDNGPWLSQGENGGSAGKLRLGKGTTFEGGMREPCIMRWPGTIRAGSVYEGLAGTLDLFPTLVGLAGGTLPEGRVYDGCDIRPVLWGEGVRPEKEFYYFNGQDLQACRHGRWKAKKPFKGNVYGEPLEHPWLLFDLERDPGETTNLADRHPAILASLQMKMDQFRKDLCDVPKAKR
ncbi:MAG: sulfatase [bacterium]